MWAGKFVTQSCDININCIMVVLLLTDPPYDLTITNCLYPEAEVTCNAKGNPAVSYQWMDANTSTVISNTNTLYITQDMLGYQWYTCIAENTYGKINESLTFQVCSKYFFGFTGIVENTYGKTSDSIIFQVCGLGE